MQPPPMADGSGSRRRIPGCQAAHPKLNKNMATILLSTLLLLTIVAAFVFGIAAGYWVILGVLHFFHPARAQRRAASALVPASGD